MNGYVIADQMKAKRNIKFLTKSEIQKIVDHIAKRDYEQDRRDIAIIELLFSTGLRISELLALKRSQLCENPWDTLEIAIIGKGGYQRTVYVSPRAQQAVLRYFACRYDIYEERAFPLTVRAVQKMVQSRAKKAGIEIRVTPHVFRHSFACHVLDKGANILYVKEFLGHKNISTTNVYLHVRNRDLEKMHSRIFDEKE